MLGAYLLHLARWVILGGRDEPGHDDLFCGRLFTQDGELPMPKIITRTLTPTIGAVVKGLDLSQPLAEEQIAEVRAALLKHKVIFFEDQHITPVQHRDFAARFGELHTHPLYPGVPEAPEMFILDNHASNPTDNDAWHTDVTFIQTPPLGAILYAKLLPPEGGDTCWANMQAAYEGLSKPLQRFLSELDAVHDFARGFPARGTVAKEAGADKHAKALEEHPPVIHPVVRTHPETGADGLFVNYGFTDRIKGLRREESTALLQMLFVHIQKPEYQVRWKWQPNSIAFWDNRITQHYAVNDYLPHRRIMNRATILGDRPFNRARKLADMRQAAE
jgi:taurine dioxygenase